MKTFWCWSAYEPLAEKQTFSDDHTATALQLVRNNTG